MDIIEQLRNADTIAQGWFIAASGLIGVFLVLVPLFCDNKTASENREKIGLVFAHQKANPKDNRRRY